MSRSLSVEQKQRVLLAHALDRKPKTLFLDEGAAHLDVDKERRINENLRALQITRIATLQFSYYSKCCYASTMTLDKSERCPEQVPRTSL